MQKKGSVTVFHLVMMFLMMFGTIGGAVKFIIDAVGSETSSALLSNITNIVLMAVIFSMLMMGAVYIIKDYSKQAAVFYKAFLLLVIQDLLPKRVRGPLAEIVLDDRKREGNSRSHTSAGDDIACGHGVLPHKIGAVVSENMLKIGITGGADPFQESEFGKDRGRCTDGSDHFSFPMEAQDVVHERG